MTTIPPEFSEYKDKIRGAIGNSASLALRLEQKMFWLVIFAVGNILLLTCHLVLNPFDWVHTRTFNFLTLSYLGYLGMKVYYKNMDELKNSIFDTVKWDWDSQNADDLSSPMISHLKISAKNTVMCYVGTAMASWSVFGLGRLVLRVWIFG